MKEEDGKKNSVDIDHFALLPATEVLQTIINYI